MKSNLSPTFRYVTPFAVWLGMTQLQSFFEAPLLFWIYGLKVVITARIFFYCFTGHMHEIRGKFDLASVGVGLAVLFFWLLFSSLFSAGPVQPSFDPSIYDSARTRAIALAFRIFGAVIVVPLIEELFWRGFLMRYLISKTFLNVPPGAYTPFSFWATALAFALFHSVSDWPAAFLAGIFYGGYLKKTGNFPGCVLAHATTNLGLAIYILMTKNWGLWG